MRRIIYLLSGPAHAQNIVVSVNSLRKFWDGPVDVFTWECSQPFVSRMQEDARLGIHMYPWNPPYHGHNNTFVDKTRLIQNLPKDDVVLFLDADTTIHKRLDELFVFAEQFGCVGTQWNDWVTTGSIISSRVRSLGDFPEIPKGLIERTVGCRWPSVNSGIFAARPDSPVLPLWNEWTYAARGTFIPDEKVFHLMQTMFQPHNQFFCAAGGFWNCSPKYQPANIPDDDVVIRHFHGDSNTRPDKSRKGFDEWWPLYEQAKQMNLGGIADWTKHAGNKWINSIEDK